MKSIFFAHMMFVGEENVLLHFPQLI